MFKVNKMWKNYNEIENDLKKISEILQSYTTISNKNLESRIKDLFNSNSKLIRPALVILFYKIYNTNLNDIENVYKLASSIELLHCATLVHDDVIDEASTRRGIDCIHKVFTNTTAIYSGDYLLAKAFENFLSYGKDIENTKKLVKILNDILQGELKQLEYRYNLDITEEKYFEIIEAKTAKLLAFSCYEGAYLANANKKELENSYNIGLYLGLSFQIIDDIIDIVSDSKISIKTTNNDFIEGYYTLPVIHSKNKNKNEILKLKEGQNKLELKEILENTGSIEYAKEIAKKYTNKALELVNEIENEKYRKIIKEIIIYLVDRKI